MMPITQMMSRSRHWLTIRDYDRIVKNIYSLMEPMPLLAMSVNSPKYVFARSGIAGSLTGAINGVAILHMNLAIVTEKDHYGSCQPDAFRAITISESNNPYGHQVKRVATPEDPASPKMGESFYRFWRTYRNTAGLKCAIQI